MELAWGLRFVLLAGVAVAAGCEGGLNNVKLPGIPTAAELRAVEEKADAYRLEFRTKKSPTAIRWLLANRVEQGMSLTEVNQQLGEDGELVDNDAGFKERNIAFQITDETYRWGPDADGHPYILFFRKDRLVNFDPKEYQ